MKTRVIIDVDNTLADSIRSWCKLAKLEHGIEVDFEDIWTPKLVGCVPMDASLIFQIQDQVWREWSTLPPTESGIDKVIQRLREDGYEIVIATSGAARHSDSIKKWLSQNGIEYHQFLSVRSKSEIDGQLLIDDVVEEVTAYVHRKRTALLYNRPWNRSKSPAGVDRLGSFQDLSEMMPKLISSSLKQSTMPNEVGTR